MVNSKEATRPAQNQDDTSSAPAQVGSAVPYYKLRDGNLSVTVFAKTKGKDVHLFIVPERSYKDGKEKWHTTHIMHEEDLPRLSQLLVEAYVRLRHKSQEFEA